MLSDFLKSGTMNNYELSEKLEGMGQIVGMKNCESDEIKQEQKQA